MREITCPHGFVPQPRTFEATGVTAGIPCIKVGDRLLRVAADALAGHSGHANFCGDDLASSRQILGNEPNSLNVE